MRGISIFLYLEVNLKLKTYWLPLLIALLLAGCGDGPKEPHTLMDYLILAGFFACTFGLFWGFRKMIKKGWL
jgi:hypothetical protein